MPGMRESGWLQTCARALEHSQTFIVAICRKLSVAQTSLNSLRISSTSRKLNCLNPTTCLIQALGGSTMALRLRYLAQPAALSSLAAFASWPGIGGLIVIGLLPALKVDLALTGFPGAAEISSSVFIDLNDIGTRKQLIDLGSELELARLHPLVAH